MKAWFTETDAKGRFPEANETLNAVIDRRGEEMVNKEYIKEEKGEVTLVVVRLQMN